MTPVSLEDVANVATFIAPGYVLLQIYAIKYSKPQRAFGRLFVESIVCSLLIVAVANVVWEYVLGQAPASALNFGYALLLFAVAGLLGLGLTYLRVHWPIKGIAQSWGFGSPDEDFIKLQFARLKPEHSGVTVTLRDGTVFAGTPDRMSRHSDNSHQYYYFTHISSYNPSSGKWSARPGGIIVERSDILHIETPELAGD